ncbi:hypothetical protein V3664_22430 [Streptomyces sp. CS62]
MSPSEGIRAVKVLERAGTVTGVLTSIGRIDSPLVVLAGGAWGSAPAEYLGIHIPVTARRIGLAQAELPGAGRRGAAASVPTCIDDTTGSYFRPDGLDRFYFGVPSKPDTELGRDVEPLTEAELEAAIAAVAQPGPRRCRRPARRHPLRPGRLHPGQAARRRRGRPRRPLPGARLQRGRLQAGARRRRTRRPGDRRGRGRARQGRAGAAGAVPAAAVPRRQPDPPGGPV